jgi:hypothetical protein
MEHFKQIAELSTSDILDGVKIPKIKGFDITVNWHGNEIIVSNDKGYKFYIKNKDPKNAERMQYFFTVADAIGEKEPNGFMNILYGFCKKQPPAFEKIKNQYPNASKHHYDNIEVHDINTVLSFIATIGERIKSRKEIEAEKYEQEKRAAYLVEYQRQEDLLNLIFSRQDIGQPLNIHTFEEAILVYNIAKTTKVKRPKNWDALTLRSWGRNFYQNPSTHPHHELIELF